MAFIIDKQTINDLKIFGKVRGNSIYSLFNATKTMGGSKILEEMFRYPLSEQDKINQRREIIEFFISKDIQFNFPSEWFDQIEHYLSDTDERSRLNPLGDSLKRRVREFIGAEVAYKQIYKGVEASGKLARQLYGFVGKFSGNNIILDDVNLLKEILESNTFAWALKMDDVKHIPYAKVVEYDNLLRYNGIEDFRRLLRIVYNLDVFSSIAQVAKKQNFAFATALPKDTNILKIKELRHPLINGAVANDIELNENNHIIFLTGANMAGKSTFMKSFGIAIYLAHIGFPVPAKEMEFSVQNGMYTTINLPDNMSMGYSHFYAEVQRLKKVAQQVGKIGHIVIVFDELFRGTNVKDAHEATIEVVKAFSEKNNCIFMISTHIIEAGEDLKKCCNSVKYVYLPTVMNGDVPTYTYKLKEGITADRHGMKIVRNEKIIDILNG